MYTLRIIKQIKLSEPESTSQEIINFELGRVYSKIQSGCVLFYRTIREEFGVLSKSTKVKCLIGDTDGRHFLILNDPDTTYYIVSDSGHTIERL